MTRKRRTRSAQEGPDKRSSISYAEQMEAAAVACELAGEHITLAVWFGDRVKLGTYNIHCWTGGSEKRHQIISASEMWDIHEKIKSGPAPAEPVQPRDAQD